MDLQMFIMTNRKLYVLITYMVLAPLAPWAPSGRTACPPLRAGPVDMAVLHIYGTIIGRLNLKNFIS
jgi:hypothetical protein